MDAENAFGVVDVRFEHYRPMFTLGVEETTPRISWRVSGQETHPFSQTAYEIELYELPSGSSNQIDASATLLASQRVESEQSVLVPWPSTTPLRSRQRAYARVRVWSGSAVSAWSDPAFVEIGLLDTADWRADRITATAWHGSPAGPQPEQLFRKEFKIREDSVVATSRLYIAVQGVYEAEINGKSVSDAVLAPGWTNYDNRIRYQTYDVSHILSSNQSKSGCIGIRLAEGWFCGRLGFAARRNIWGPYPAFVAQLEIKYQDGTTDLVQSDSTWSSVRGPSTLAEIYDGEKYDATLEVPGWSEPQLQEVTPPEQNQWQPVTVLAPLPQQIKLVAGWCEPVRRIEVVQPVETIVTPSGKTVIDFGQNLVGYLRLKDIHATKGHKISLYHAEVLEGGELGRRPLRACDALDEYTCKGATEGETWEPRYTFHGFRYCQVDNWPQDQDLTSHIEAVVCHTDMERTGSFECSDPMLNKLYANAVWSMRGNFFHIPTDCPQRDERLGWTGDIALFGKTATKIYDCYNILKDWLVDVSYEQGLRGGIPSYVTPNVIHGSGVWGLTLPIAIWHDVAILLPWALYEAYGDPEILRVQYTSMQAWIKAIPRDSSRGRVLWDPESFQLGDWLDPTAPPEQPMQGRTDRILVADAFLIRSLDLISKIAEILGHQSDSQNYGEEASAARQQFAEEYITAGGRIASDSQTAYALAICFDLFPSSAQRSNAGSRLAKIVRMNNFKVDTGFAGTPFICEALAQTDHVQVAYSMLLCRENPSWLYPVSLGATTVWERWDSMLPDGSINPGEMTSFNHYCFGAVVSFMEERLVGLRSTTPGWSSVEFAPAPGGGITSASATYKTPHGEISAGWEIVDDQIQVQVVVPPMTSMTIVIPSAEGSSTELVASGKWAFSRRYVQDHEWPIKAIPAFPI